MSGNFLSGSFKTLNRTAQPAPAVAPSPTGQTSEAASAGGSIIDTIRKRMQQMKDELAGAQDDLQHYQIEREREKHTREQVCPLEIAFSIILIDL